MNTVKFKAYSKEFPFLNAIREKEDYTHLESISIKKIDSMILNHTPGRMVSTGSMVNINNVEKISIVFSDGEIFHDCVRQAVDAHHHEAYLDNILRAGESILQAIDRLDVIARNIKYIVSVESGYDIINHYSTNLWRVTIYKTSKSEIISDLLNRAREIARKMVEAESNF